LHLTPAQIAAAMALGIRFPAATLQRLIEAHQVEDAQQQADLAAWEASSAAAPSPSSQPVPKALPSRPTAPPTTVPETLARLAEAPAPAVAAAETVSALTPRRRWRHQRTPGWMTAGAVRRGRVDQHWSTRARQ
jgi:hypothetical protein